MKQVRAVQFVDGFLIVEVRETNGTFLDEQYR